MCLSTTTTSKDDLLVGIFSLEILCSIKKCQTLVIYTICWSVSFSLIKCNFSLVGGVKRPAEGSKEEPSEKKNQPVVTKMLESKSGMENCLPSTVTARKSPKVDGTAVEVNFVCLLINYQTLDICFFSFEFFSSFQRVVLADSVNKTGTLNSKCVACKSHVHLVQRHFVEGKLYHRSCFK